MEIPKNSLTEEFNEVVRLCEEAKEYSNAASWFAPPATEEEITGWEKENGIKIPESYKDWLRLTGSSLIKRSLAKFYGVQEIEVDSKYYPEDYVIIGELIGDGERLCFSKSSGKIIRYNHGDIRTFNDFKTILQDIIRMCKDESGLSEEVEDSLLALLEKQAREEQINKGND